MQWHTVYTSFNLLSPWLTISNAYSAAQSFRFLAQAHRFYLPIKPFGNILSEVCGCLTNALWEIGYHCLSSFLQLVMGGLGPEWNTPDKVWAEFLTKYLYGYTSSKTEITYALIAHSPMISWKCNPSHNWKNRKTFIFVIFLIFNLLDRVPDNATGVCLHYETHDYNKSLDTSSELTTWEVKVKLYCNWTNMCDICVVCSKPHSSFPSTSNSSSHAMRG